MIQFEISDLISRIKLKKRDLFLFVEGRQDEKIIKNFLKLKGNKNSVQVYRIELVKVPYEIIEKHQLNHHSSRSKVIALYYELKEKYNNFQSVKFIIDRDLDDFIPKNIESDELYYTDFSSTELYLFDQRLIGTFLDLSGYVNGLNFHEFESKITPHLNHIFWLRLIFFKKKINISVKDVEMKLSIKQKQLKFNIKNHLLNILRKHDLHSMTDEIHNEMLNLQAQYPKVAKKAIHGHDFVDFVYDYLKSSNNNGLRKDQMEKELYHYYSHVDILNEYTLFQKILQFAN